MKVRHCSLELVLCALLFSTISASAQGTLEDYQRAERFLPGNLHHHIDLADVAPHWIDKTDRFWYRKAGPGGTQFILVDADKNTSAPAFDHARLAAALSQATKQTYSPTDLPFSEFEFLENEKAIRFELNGTRWRCDVTSYDCHSDSAPSEKPNETISPNKRWAAYVSDHDLYLRDLSTGTALRLTDDGLPGYDYAAPLPSLRVMVDQKTEDVKQPAAVFWAPDSSKLVTYRIDSRNSGRFTSL